MDDEIRLDANDRLMDEMAARIEDLERRLDGLLKTLRQGPALQALGLHDYDFQRAEASDMPLRFRAYKHEGARLKALAKLREEKTLWRLSLVPPDRLEELLRPPTARPEPRKRKAAGRKR